MHYPLILLFKVSWKLTLTENIINQSEPQKQDRNQILEKKLNNLSDFE